MSFYRSHEFCEIVLCVSIKNAQHREVEQLVARKAHNLEVTRSNRVFATPRNPYVGAEVSSSATERKVDGSNPSRTTLSFDSVVFYIFGHQERN